METVGPLWNSKVFNLNEENGNASSTSILCTRPDMTVFQIGRATDIAILVMTPPRQLLPATDRAPVLRIIAICSCPITRLCD
jgi:hypothetical protein